MISTSAIIDGLTDIEGHCLLKHLNTAARQARQAAERLDDFAELITFLTGRDADEYLRDAKTTGYPPLTSQSDVRTTVLGDSAPSNENPQ